MAAAITEYLQDFIQLLYPRYCLACYEGLVKGEDLLCTACIHHLPRTDFHLQPHNTMYQRIVGRLPVHHAFAFLHFHKRGKVQRMLHELKYRNHPELGLHLGKVYGSDLHSAKLTQHFDLLIPVPLHPVKQRRRGYNQSEMFARGLAESMNLPCVTQTLVRTAMTETQTRKTKLKRWQNVETVFSVKYQEAILGKRILLVDDVITTGATAEACGQVLLLAGASSISVAGIAYTH